MRPFICTICPAEIEAESPYEAASQLVDLLQHDPGHFPSGPYVDVLDLQARTTVRIDLSGADEDKIIMTTTTALLQLLKEVRRRLWNILERDECADLRQQIDTMITLAEKDHNALL